MMRNTSTKKTRAKSTYSMAANLPKRSPMWRW
jgi:hypothetical protein